MALVKDYYEVLGVPREATEDDIKRTYKKLAVRWHPDKNPDDHEAAILRFQEISEAYSVLGDADKRETYDKNAPTGFKQGFRSKSMNRAGPSNGYQRTYNARPKSYDDVFGNGKIDPNKVFEDILGRDESKGLTGDRSTSQNGPARTGPKNQPAVHSFGPRLHNPPMQGPPPAFNSFKSRPNDGAEPFSPLRSHAHHGPSKGPVNASAPKGPACPAAPTTPSPPDKLKTAPKKPPGPVRTPPKEVVVETTLEELYMGTNKVLTVSRNILDGVSGKSLEVEQQLEINIKPGYRDNFRIFFAGCGDEVLVDHPPSDLFVVIKELPHPMFRRVGDDLHLNVKVPLVTALVGPSTSIRTLDGREVDVPLQEVITPGGVQVVLGEGMPGGDGGKRGDLYLDFDVEFPRQLNEDQKSLIAAALSIQNP